MITQKQKQIAKQFYIGFCCIICILTMGYIALGYAFCQVAFSSAFVITMEPPFEQPDFPQLEETEWLINESGRQAVELVSYDGATVTGWEILQPEYTNQWVITIHGYRGTSEDMSYYAKTFYDAGFNVLMPNLRGHSGSGGEYIRMGWYDRLDIVQWIQGLVAQDAQCEIVLHGVSMGAATVMMTTGETLPSNVKVAIEDCGYTSVYDQFAYILEEFGSIPARPIMDIAIMFAKRFTGFDITEASCIQQLQKSKTPTLFIHGTEDDFVPFTMLEQLYNANPTLPKEKLMVEGAAHAYAATVNPTAYWNAVFGMIDKYM